MPNSKNKTKSKSFFKRFIGDSSDFKRGIKMVADGEIVTNPIQSSSTWLKDKGKKKDAAWLKKAKQKFRARYFFISCLLLLFTLWLTMFVFGSLVATIAAFIVVFAVEIFIYRWVLEQVKLGEDEKDG